MSSPHPIHSFDEREPELLFEEDDLKLGIVDEDEEAGIPLFGVALENESKCCYGVPSDGHLRVLYVTGEEAGDIERLVTTIADRHGVTEVSFINPHNQASIEDELGPLRTRTVSFEQTRAIVGTVQVGG